MENYTASCIDNTEFTQFKLRKLNYTTVEIKNFDEIYDDEDELSFNPEYPTVLVTHGFSPRIGSWAIEFNDDVHACVGTPDWVQLMMSTLACHPKKMNLILFDWTRAADQPYQQSAANTRGAGRIMAMFIDSLKENFEGKFKLSDVHLIGFSLGGHTVGYAGKWLNKIYPTPGIHDEFGNPINFENSETIDKTNFRGLGKITGLDPAGIGFDTKMASFRLNRYDAKYVEVIHTDQWGSLTVMGAGTTVQSGDVDIWVNNATAQAHCVTKTDMDEEDNPNAKRNKVTIGDLLGQYSVGAILTSLCDHMTAPKYYNDIIRRDANGLMPFVAYHKSSFSEFMVSKKTQLFIAQSSDYCITIIISTRIVNSSTKYRLCAFMA